MNLFLASIVIFMSLDTFAQSCPDFSGRYQQEIIKNAYFPTKPPDMIITQTGCSEIKISNNPDIVVKIDGLRHEKPSSGWEKKFYRASFNNASQLVITFVAGYSYCDQIMEVYNYNSCYVSETIFEVAQDKPRVISYKINRITGYNVEDYNAVPRKYIKQSEGIYNQNFIKLP